MCNLVPVYQGAPPAVVSMLAASGVLHVKVIHTVACCGESPHHNANDVATSYQLPSELAPQSYINYRELQSAKPRPFPITAAKESNPRSINPASELFSATFFSTNSAIMTRGESTQSKVHYKGSQDDFLVFVEDVDQYKAWLKGDTSIPLAQFISSFKIFVTHRYDIFLIPSELPVAAC